MSDRRKSRMSCPPLRPCRLSSCNSLPKYNLIWGWRHLAIHTSACRMTSTAVWPCITCLEGQQGSLSFSNMTHIEGITAAYSPVSKIIYFSFSAGDVKQGAMRDMWILFSSYISYIPHLTADGYQSQDNWCNDTCSQLIKKSCLEFQYKNRHRSPDKEKREKQPEGFFL